jgi:hypothetical protein
VAVSDVTNSAKFPNSPDVVGYAARFEWPTGPDDATPPPGNVKNEYGVQISGYFYPTANGLHVFHLCSDDGSILYLSTDSNPANKKLIAVETLWSPVRQYDASAGGSDVSAKTSSTYAGSQWPGGGGAINLTAGQPYYIEAIMKEGGGGDNLSVSLDGVGPIPGSQLSTIDRATLGQPYLASFTGSGGGIWYYAIEPQDTVNQGTVQLTLNGNAVTPTFTKSGTNLTISFRVTVPLAIGSTNTSSLNFTDSAGLPQAIQKTFVVGSYATVPANYATTTFSGDGMAVFIHQIDFVDQFGAPTSGRAPGLENSVYNAETQLGNGFLDPLNNDLPYANVALAPVNSTVTTVNWEQLAGEINANDPQPDNFNGTEPANSPRPNAAIPSIPSFSSTPDNNIAASITMYLELKQGWNRLGVNSDDGFTLRASRGAGNVIEGQMLGLFDGGRGASDTLSDFWVAADGVYPVRLAWWEGDGGANVEFFSENIESGQRILVNDRIVTGHLKAYPVGRGSAYTRVVLPYPGKVGAPKRTPFKIQVIDDLTSYVPNSFVLAVDGTTVSNPTIVSAGGTNTLTWTPATDYQFGSLHTGYYLWRENTTPETTHSNTLSFTIVDFTPDDLPSYTQGSFWIEFEDFDGTGDPGFAGALALANQMPYAGGAYDGVSAVEGVDYNNGDAAADGNVYRTELDINGENEVSMYNNVGGRFGARRTGGFDMTANYAIGWAGSTDEWNNYTRNITNGLYRAFAAMSHGESNPGQLSGELREVTSGVGTATQTTKTLGTFSAPGTGAWGSNALVPMNDAAGAPAVFKVKNFPGSTTLRFYSFNGDYDWFVLVPVTGVAPGIASISPRIDLPVYRDISNITWTIEDFSTAVVTNTIRLTFGGVDVSSQLSISKPATDMTTVTYTPAQLLNGGQTYVYDLIFRDNGTTPTTKTNTGTLVTHYLPRAAVGGAFVIEAEDFNFNGGQVMPDANTMPYAGGAFDTLSAVAGVDYQRSANEPSGDIYRLTEDPNVPMGGATGTNQEQPGTVPDVTRAGWDITQSFSLGWAGGGNWMNYTRQVPANTYQIWAAMSYGGGTGANLLSGNLLRVTSPATNGTQTTVPMGVFRGPGTGGWGANALLPMRDTNNVIQSVQLSGEVTFRFENVSGDFDYFMLIPTSTGPRFNAPVLAGNTLTISWTGTGTIKLQQASNLTGSPADWGDVAGNPSSPYTVNNVGSSPRTFYRLVSP